MTNEQAKQEAIKKAYGKYYDELHLSINHETGWCYVFKGNIHNEIESKIRVCPYHDSWIPKVLLNLEDNSGWIRIEINRSNLPKIGQSFYMYMTDGSIKRVDNVNAVDNWFTPESNEISCTHYKPIIPEPKPVY